MRRMYRVEGDHPKYGEDRKEPALNDVVWGIQAPGVNKSYPWEHYDLHGGQNEGHHCLDRGDGIFVPLHQYPPIPETPYNLHAAALWCVWDKTQLLSPATRIRKQHCAFYFTQKGP